MGFWDDVDDQDFQPVTPGNYTALLEDATLDTTYTNSKGVNYPILKLRWKIEGSSHEGRSLFQDIRFMDALKWKVNMELKRLDALPDVPDSADWSQVAEEAATLVFPKVSKYKVLLDVKTREWEGKTYNEVGIKESFGDLTNTPKEIDKSESLPF